MAQQDWGTYCKANGESLYIAWCNGQRMTLRKLGAIHNWVKWQLWAEWDRNEDETTDEARRLSDVLAAVNCDIAKLQK